MLLALALLCSAVTPAYHARHHSSAGFGAARASLLSASASAGAIRGSLLKVVHRVADPEGVASFYTSAFGLESLPIGAADDCTRRLLASGSVSPQLELVHTDGAAYTSGGSYRGLSMRVPDVAAAVAAATSHGGSVLEHTQEVAHGPSNEPPEDDETITPVVEAVVADPSGFPVHLYQAECEAGAICGVRLDVYEWKKSSEWYASELGWKMLRWQSDVPRKASLSVLLGGPGSSGTVGPVGAASDEQAAPLLSLRYVYGCAAKEGAGGLEALVLAAGDGDTAELSDPDANPIRLV